MMNRCVRKRGAALALVVFAWLLTTGSSRADEATELAHRIDQRLADHFVAHGIVPAAQADDGEFLRRVTLDLIGRPPTVQEAEAFLKSDDLDKRAAWIERMQADAAHADHFATTWRALLIPEADSEPQIRYFVPGFEAWLRERFLSGVGIDAMARELIAAPIAAVEEDSPQMVLRDLKAPNPLAYLASKQADPGTIAAGTVRLFMGLRLECAQCHDHPYGSWTQEQFWHQAAFFAGIERRGSSIFSPLVEDRSRNEIMVAESTRLVSTQFLDGTSPRLDASIPLRSQFADWITSPDNPWFAKALANRVWASLMGRGIVDPVDDFGTLNPPSHPELLDDLAAALVDSGFNISFLQAAICKSQAYQRTSRSTGHVAGKAEAYAAMSIKPMSGEQFLAALSQAVSLPSNQDRIKQQILSQFSGNGLYHDPETSVSQSLTLMNGDFINNAVGQAAELLSQQAELSSDRTLELLYLGTVSRYPTKDELAVCLQYLSEDVAGETERIGDLLWSLCNSAEFRFNH